MEKRRWNSQHFGSSFFISLQNMLICPLLHDSWMVLVSTFQDLNGNTFGYIFFPELCCGPLWKGFSLPPSPCLLTNVRTYALVLPPIPTFCRTILCYFSVDLLSSLLLGSVFLWEELHCGPSWKDQFLSSPCWQMLGLMLLSQPNWPTQHSANNSLLFLPSQWI